MCNSIDASYPLSPLPTDNLYSNRPKNDLHQRIDILAQKTTLTANTSCSASTQSGGIRITSTQSGGNSLQPIDDREKITTK